MAKKIPLSILKSVKEYVSVLQKEISVQKVIIYGSYAKGTFNKDSDIDIVIVSKNFGKNPHEDNVYLWSKLWKISEKRIEPRAYSTKDFQSTYMSPLLYEIHQHGIKIKI